VERGDEFTPKFKEKDHPNHSPKGRENPWFEIKLKKIS
jgi:hypothetical protein